MKTYKSPLATILFWIVTAAFCFVFLYCLTGTPKENSKVLYQDQMGWYSESGNSFNFNSKADVSAEIKDGYYSASFSSSEYNENMSLFFKTHFSDVEVYLNGKLIYFTKTPQNSARQRLFAFKAPASENHFASIKRIDEGDIVSVRVRNYYDSNILGISDIMYGRASEITDIVFRNDVFGIVICIALFALCFIMLIFHFSFRKVVTLKGLKYAAFLAFFTAVFSLSRSTAISFLMTFGDNALYILHNISFAVLPVSLILFFTENIQLRRLNSVMIIMTALQALLVALISILAATNSVDLYQSFFAVEIVTLVQCLLMLAILIVDLIKKSEITTADIAMPVMYAVFTGIAIYGYITGKGGSIPVLFALSCLLFLSVVLVFSMISIADTLKLSAEAENMGKAAFTDALTQVGNTAAYNKKIRHLEVVKVNYKAIAIIQFDINNLKTINDNLGHEQGDKLIVDGSGIINKVFGKIGDVYRTGGDEFVAVVCGDRALALCNEAFGAFERAIAEYNTIESHAFILQIAYGADYYLNDNNDRYVTLKDIQKQADAYMYEKKREMKTHVTKEQILKLEPYVNPLI